MGPGSRKRERRVLSHLLMGKEIASVAQVAAEEEEEGMEERKVEAVSERAVPTNLSRLRSKVIGVTQALVHIDMKKGAGDRCGQG